MSNPKRDHLISEGYKKMNTALHEDYKNYGNQNSFLSEKLPLVCDAFNKHYNYSSILDYGCGKGLIINSLKQHLRRHTYDISGYDPCVSEFASEPKPADIVMCTDVLEHIEPEKIETVIKHIKDLTNKICYLVIDLLPAQKKLPDGRNAHLIIAPAGWWLNELSKQFAFGLHFVGGSPRNENTGMPETKKLVYVGTNKHKEMVQTMNFFSEIHIQRRKK